MKRSEMISKMVELIEGEHTWDGPKCKISLEYAMGIAMNILDMQEKEGMLPPAIDNLAPWDAIELEWEPE